MIDVSGCTGLCGFCGSVMLFVGVSRVMKKYFGGGEQHQSAGKAYEALIGGTPMAKLQTASSITGCNVLVKMECMNVGGTGKDRAAQRMLEMAAAEGILKPGGHVVEGTSGSTGISLACLCLAHGYKLHVVMPDDQADEKRALLERLGVNVTVVPCCAISNKRHYVKVAQSLAKELGGFFVNQFENLSNFEVHRDRTGPEILLQSMQMAGRPPDAFVMSAGTGGTIAGVSRYLSEVSPHTKVILADPEGSSLFHRVQSGVCYTPQQSERSVRRHRYDSIVEGVGLDRVTANFEQARVHSALRVCDQDILDTAHWLLREEGIFAGSSSALNVAAACRVALQLGPGHTVVTVVCDNGGRHLSRFWNPQYVSKYNLKWPGSADRGDCLPAYFK